MDVCWNGPGQKSDMNDEKNVGEGLSFLFVWDVALLTFFGVDFFT